MADDDDDDEEEEPIDEADESAAPPSQVEAPLASSAVAAKPKVRVAIAMSGPWHCGTAALRSVTACTLAEPIASWKCRTRP